MELVVSHEAFADAVAWAARSLPARPTSAILGGLLLRAGTDVESGGAGLGSGTTAAELMTVSGFDYETSATAGAVARVAVGGSVLVSGRLLAEITRALPRDEVAITTMGSKVVIACGGYEYTLQSMPIDDYPHLPAMPASVGDVSAALLTAAVAQVAVAAGRDEALPFLTGLRIELGSDTLRFVATDRYRLAVREIPWTTSTDVGGAALVPARIVQELTRSLPGSSRVGVALSGMDGSGGAGAGEGLIGFSTADRESTARLLDGEFIKYDRIFPSSYAGCAVVETAPLVQAVKAIALVAERNAPLRLAFSAGSVRVEASSGDTAQATVTLDAAFDGEDFALAANPAYLLDGLNSLHAPYAQLSFTTSTKPAVLTGRSDSYANPEDPMAAELGYRYLFLPLRQLG